MGAERAGSGSPFTPVSYSDDREASDSDKDLIEKKRKTRANRIVPQDLHHYHFHAFVLMKKSIGER